ncbi:MAG: putative molybdenum carrier protein [Kiritimatiellae bacterium]|nr:putative molybdenum carrier protein [Kiritimatiellia bacterium]MDD5520159.1 putative molybdenum carrier protein [Kiritimatiellia bacterium]
MSIIKIVSGGQTGADRGGLEAAICCGVPHGGWCPNGRKAEDGRIPDKYQLKEMTSDEYSARTEANVVDSDCTIVFTEGPPSDGSLHTLEFCQKHGKPWHHINLKIIGHDAAVQEIIKWLNGKEDGDYEYYTAQPPAKCVLNVAGSRESKSPGILKTVTAIMIDVMKLCVIRRSKIDIHLPD